VVHIVVILQNKYSEEWTSNVLYLLNVHILNIVWRCFDIQTSLFLARLNSNYLCFTYINLYRYRYAVGNLYSEVLRSLHFICSIIHHCELNKRLSPLICDPYRFRAGPDLLFECKRWLNQALSVLCLIAVVFGYFVHFFSNLSLSCGLVFEWLTGKTRLWNDL